MGWTPTEGHNKTWKFRYSIIAKEERRLKTDLTKELEKNLFLGLKPHMGTYGFYEVTIQDGYDWKRIDFVTMDRKGIIKCYEIKTSYSDFKSKNGHNFYGHYNYYVLPAELIERVKRLVPAGIGIVNSGVNVYKRAKKQIVDDEIRNNLILGMCCAGDRETRKLLLINDEDLVQHKNNQIQKLSKEKDYYYWEYVSAKEQLKQLNEYISKNRSERERVLIAENRELREMVDSY